MMFISAVKNSTLEKNIYSFSIAFLELTISKKKIVFFFKEEFFFFPFLSQEFVAAAVLDQLAHWKGT